MTLFLSSPRAVKKTNQVRNIRISKTALTPNSHTVEKALRHIKDQGAMSAETRGRENAFFHTSCKGLRKVVPSCVFGWLLIKVY